MAEIKFECPKCSSDKLYLKLAQSKKSDKNIIGSIIMGHYNEIHYENGKIKWKWIDFVSPNWIWTKQKDIDKIICICGFSDNDFHCFIKNNFNKFVKTSSNEEILDLKNKLIKANKTIEQQELTIIGLQNKLNSCNIIISNYQNIINQKDTEMNNLKMLLDNNPNLQNKIFINEIMCVNFTSTVQKIHFAVGCVKNNTFAEIEEKLYQQYPEYRETNNNFIANGTEILRFKTIEQNKIGNGLPVTLIVQE